MSYVEFYYDFKISTKIILSNDENKYTGINKFNYRKEIS